MSQRLEALLAQGLVREVGEGRSTGGRPPTVLAFHGGAKVILAANVGNTRTSVAVADLDGTSLAEDAGGITVDDGPDIALQWIEDRFEALLREVARPDTDVAGVGIGIAGPVEFATGDPHAGLILPGWSGARLTERFSCRYQVPTLVDNDANVMAIGEHWAKWPDAAHLLFVKVDSGIGSGVVAGGRLLRGVHGVAGALGHVQVEKHSRAACNCGNVGCLQAVASGRAVAERLRSLGVDATDADDVVRLVREGQPEASRLVREAGRDVGEVVAMAVNVLNPGVVVIGGSLGSAHDHLLTGVREVVYRRSLPMATRNITISRSVLGERAATVGAAAMVIEHVLPGEVSNGASAGRGNEFLLRS